MILWMRALAAGMAVAMAGCLSFHAGPLPGEPKDATFAVVDGVRLRYVDTGGDGPVVVLVHGFSSSLDIWSDVIPKLARTHRVIALDLKGFGWSGRPDGDYSPRAQAELVLGLLDARGVDGSFSIVGHSWGASVTLAVVLAARERVERVALYSAWVFEEQLPTFFLWARRPGIGEFLFSLYYDERFEDRVALAFYDPAAVPQSRIDEAERELNRPGSKAAALAAVRGQRYRAMQRQYKTIEQPTLLLWGREDRITSLSYGERLASELRNAQLIVFPRCGHIPMREQASATTGALVKFLNGGRS